MGNFDTLVFSKEDTSWFDGAGELVSREMVENMVFAVDRMQKKSIVGEEEISGCDYGVKLVFKKKGKLISDFLYASGNLGDFVYVEGSKKAYGVEISGFENLSLKKVFSLNPDHYHLHMLIDLLPSEIAEVEVWPLSGSSFRLIQDKKFNLRVTEGGIEKDISGTLNEHKLRMLLTYFNAIKYTEQVDEAVLQKPSIARVMVKDIDGKEIDMEIFAYYPGTAEDADLFKAVVKSNVKPGLLLVDYYHLDLLIRGLEYYR
jgi:hypothetical protein